MRKPVINKKQGFTLIELMIAIAIVAIVAAIGYPSYLGQVKKTERKRVVSRMLEVSSRMERIQSQQFSYQDPGDVQPPEVKYTLSVTVPQDGLSYLISADPAGFGRQADDICGIMTLDQAGVWSFSNGLTEDDCI